MKERSKHRRLWITNRLNYLYRLDEEKKLTYPMFKEIDRLETELLELDEIEFYEDTDFERDLCVRCENTPTVPGYGALCSHCHWAVIAEITHGLYKIGVYLKNWAHFREWERTHETVIP